MDKDLSFLWLKPTLEEAWNTEPSPYVSIFSLPMIQLLPLNPKPYIQITDSRESINLGAPSTLQRFLVDECGVELELNDYIDALNFTDANGVNQVWLRLKYLPLDFGMTRVYLKLTNDGGVEWYSNPFLLTAQDQKYTSRLDYRTETPDDIFYQSIQLRFAYNRHVDADDLEVYYQISKGQNVISRVNEDSRIEWVFERCDGWTWRRLKTALYRSPCYINAVRNYPVEALELEARDGDTGVSENFFITDPREGDVINIIEIIIDPDIENIDFLASSSSLASSAYLVSQSEIPQP